MLKKTALPLLLSTALFAGPPMLTNDPFTPEKDFEINIATELEKTEGATSVTPLLDMNYVPIKDVLELTLQTSYQTIFEDEKTDYDSVANFEMKYHFLKGEMFNMAVVGSYRTFPLNNEAHDGNIAEIQFPMSFHINKELSLVVTPAYSYPTENTQDAAIPFGSYIAYEEGEHVFLLEGFSEYVLESKELLYTINAGYTYKIDETFSFLFSLGDKLKSENSSEEGIISYIGIQTRF